MSNNKPDERDIDEILASIDEMLSQKDSSAFIFDERKDAVQDSAQDSKDKLNLSSSVEHQKNAPSKALEPQQPIDESIKEAFAEPSLDTSGSDNTEGSTGDVIADADDAEYSGTDTPESESSTESDTIDAVIEDVSEANNVIDEKNDDVDEAYEKNAPRQRVLLTEALLEPSAQEALPLWVASEQDSAAEPTDEMIEDVDDNTIEQAQNVSEDQGSEIDDKQSSDEVVEQPVEEDTTEANKDEALSSETVGTHLSEDNSTENNLDETQTFDIEDINTDSTHQDDEEYPLESVDDLDDNTELVEVMMADILHQPDSEVQQNINQHIAEEGKHITHLNDADLKWLVESVSEDISQQLEVHLSVLLPKLVTLSLQQHLKSLNHKDNE